MRIEKKIHFVISLYNKGIVTIQKEKKRKEKKWTSRVRRRESTMATA